MSRPRSFVSPPTHATTICALPIQPCWHRMNWTLPACHPPRRTCRTRAFGRLFIRSGFGARRRWVELMTAPIRDNQTVGAKHMPGKARAGGPEQGNLTRGNGIILPTFPPCHSTRSKCWGNRSAEVAATGRSDHLRMNSMRISVCASLPLLSPRPVSNNCCAHLPWSRTKRGKSSRSRSESG